MEAFLSTLDDLNLQAQNLVHDFFPEYSGQGLTTLVPVFELIRRVGDDLRRDRASDVEADEEKLEELVRDALRPCAGRRAFILVSAVTLAAVGVYQLVASLLRARAA